MTNLSRRLIGTIVLWVVNVYASSCTTTTHHNASAALTQQGQGDAVGDANASGRYTGYAAMTNMFGNGQKVCQQNWLLVNNALLRKPNTVPGFYVSAVAGAVQSLAEHPECRDDAKLFQQIYADSHTNRQQLVSILRDLDQDTANIPDANSDEVSSATAVNGDSKMTDDYLQANRKALLAGYNQAANSIATALAATQNRPITCLAIWSMVDRGLKKALESNNVEGFYDGGAAAAVHVMATSSRCDSEPDLVTNIMHDAALTRNDVDNIVLFLQESEENDLP